MLTIEIETTTAAFDNGNETAELVRILRDTAQRIEDGYRGAKLYDYNGNHVGYCEYEPSEEEEE